MNRLIAAALAACAASTAASAEEVWLTMDYVQPFKFSQPVSELIIGNPGIADVKVQNNDSILLFGKSPGTTNIIVLDENGAKLQDLIVRVQTRSDNALTFQRGSERTTYSCTDTCEATVTVGDGKSFGETVGQVQQKYQQAAGSGPTE